LISGSLKISPEEKSKFTKILGSDGVKYKNISTGIDYSEKEIKKANLEDVFIQLTGKEWRAE
jgi:hypothetical protein